MSAMAGEDLAVSLEELLAAEPADEWFLVWMPPVLHRSWRKRLFGEGSWALLTVAQYYAGDSPYQGNIFDGPQTVPVRWLATWTAQRLGYPVALVPAEVEITPTSGRERWIKVPVYLIRRNT